MKNRKLLLIVSLILALTMAMGSTLAYLTDTDEAVNVMTLGNVDIEQIELQRKEGIKHNATLAEGDLEPFEQGQALYPAFPVHNDPNDYEAARNEADALKWSSYVTADVAEGGTAWNGLFNEDNLVGAMDKFVFVENTGDSSCYYRTWLAFECPEGLVFSTQGVKEANKPDLWINTNGNDRFVWEWEDDEFVTIDGVRYLLMCATYQKELPAGEISRPSLLQVALTHYADNADMAALGETYEILAFSQAVQTANMPNANAALTAAFGAPTVENHPWKDENGNDYVPGLPTKTVKTAEELKAALAEGGIVVLADDIVVEETITVPSGATATLMLAGHSITQTKACDKSYEMIANNGNLTITGNGKISFTDTGAGDSSFGWGSYTVRNSGTLVVEDATIEHLGTQAFGTHAIMPIFQYSGSTTINSGTISCPNYRSVRLWGGDMTINGGTFDGQVWLQDANANQKSNMTINGGSFSPNGGDGSSVFVGNGQGDISFAVTGGNFETKIGCTNADALAGCITGGTFTDAAKANTNPVLFAE